MHGQDFKVDFLVEFIFAIPVQFLPH